MMKYFGRVLVETMYQGTPGEKLVYVLVPEGGKMRELRWDYKGHAPIFQTLENSPFHAFLGKDVVVEGKLYNDDVIVTSKIWKRVP